MVAGVLPDRVIRPALTRLGPINYVFGPNCTIFRKIDFAVTAYIAAALTHDFRQSSPHSIYATPDRLIRHGHRIVGAPPFDQLQLAWTDKRCLDQPRQLTVHGAESPTSARVEKRPIVD
jgi:hypothetical protein